MSKRKIAVSHNIRVNVGNYQHIDSTFYAEEEIEFQNESERVTKENEVNDQVVTFLIRSLRSLPERLGKNTDAVQVVEESIKKTVPSWFDSDPIPNLANQAKSNHNKVVSEQKQSKDEKTSTVKNTPMAEENSSKTVKAKKTKDVEEFLKDDEEDFDLF